MNLTYLSFRARLLLLVIFGAIPAFVLNGYNAVIQRDRAMQTTQTDALNIVRLVAGEQSRLLTSARQFLLGISKLPIVRSPQTSAACNQTLTELNSSYPFYTNIGVAQLNGDMFCNSRPMPGQVNIADRSYFRRALETHDFGIGDYQIGRVTRRSSINLGFPVTDKDGNTHSVIFTAIDLDWLNQLLAGIKLPEDSEILILDSQGTILAHYPTAETWIGKKMSDSELVSTILRMKHEGTMEFVGNDNVPRFYAFTPVRDVSGANIYVSVGLSKKIAFAAANTDLRRTYIGFIVALLLLIVLAWVGSNIFVLKRIKALAAAAKKLGSGELSMRTGLLHSKDELGELAFAFDSMADALQKLNEDLEDRVALRTRQLEEALESQKQRTLIDPLTNLPNRLLFNDRLAQAILKVEQDNKILAVAFIDIDDFKVINDVYGHLGGDTVLKLIGGRLRSAVSVDSTVARMGGDEFALVITAESKNEITNIIDNLYKTLVAPIDIGSRSREINVSIGIAFYPDHGRSQQDLLDRADVAMYSAKQEDDGVRVYTPDTDRDRRSRMSMIDDVRGAVERGDIKLYYQPQYDYTSGSIVGAVGVARWEHPKLGVVKPLVFMPIVHDNGLTKQLTRKFIEDAILQIVSWQKQNIELPISVKIDADSITDQDLSSYVESLLGKHNVKAKLLEFAIQESALMLSPTLTREVLFRLQRLGVSIIIEEFGTGYGSMGWITNTIAPLSQIKISRKYVLGMSSNQNYMTYIQSLINVAHALKLKVVADGVENEAAWEELKTLGCDFALGYYHSRPVSPADFEKWYKTENPIQT